MTKKLLLTTALLSTTFIHAEQSETTQIKHPHATHWSYEGAGAPENWAQIDKKNFICKEGSNQSPINLTNFIEADLPTIQFDYKKIDTTEIVNNGHTEQINIKPGSSITVDNIKFELKQFHFHTPSENNINGNSFPLEVHFVHVSKDGRIAVVAVMFKEGANNIGLVNLLKGIPTHTGEHHSIHAHHLEALLPKDKDYYRFNGSLTTPPCTEGVRWLVMKKPITISKEQIHVFKKVMKVHNNRPIQPTNSRMILK